jgi:hypothetical protein
MNLKNFTNFINSNDHARRIIESRNSYLEYQKNVNRANY